MTKKSCFIIPFLIVFILQVFFQFSGCFLLDTTTPSNSNSTIYKDYIELDISSSEDFQIVSNRNSSNIVTLLSSGSVSVKGKSSEVTNISSGIILNDEGYILTTSDVMNLKVDVSDQIYSGKTKEVFAVLADIYGDNNHYLLKLVDCNPKIGLALFQFRNSFSFYKDNQKTSSEKGFQFDSIFYCKALNEGEQCVAIGNSITEIYLSKRQSHKAFKNLKMQATSGIIAKVHPENSAPIILDNNNYYKSLISSAVNPEMIGGAVLNRNGQIIGLIFEKVKLHNSVTDLYLQQMTYIYESPLLISYVNSVSEKTQKTIIIQTVNTNEAVQK